MSFTFHLVDTDGQILESFKTAEPRWQTGDTVIAHGNRHYRVVSVIPVERISEFADEPSAGFSRSSPCSSQSTGGSSSAVRHASVPE
jgi:hypothetical protein